MFGVIFIVEPKPSRFDEYLELAKSLKPEIEKIDGFVDNERFRSTRREGRVLSLSTWRDEKAVVRWRTLGVHHSAQEKGRFEIFDDYHLRVGEVTPTLTSQGGSNWCSDGSTRPKSPTPSWSLSPRSARQRGISHSVTTSPPISVYRRAERTGSSLRRRSRPSTIQAPRFLAQWRCRRGMEPEASDCWRTASSTRSHHPRLRNA